MRVKQRAGLCAKFGVLDEARAQAEEIRKAEKHKVTMSIATMRKQGEKMKLGDETAKMLPPDFDISELNSVLSAAAPSRISAD